MFNKLIVCISVLVDFDKLQRLFWNSWEQVSASYVNAKRYQGIKFLNVEKQASVFWATLFTLWHILTLL